MEDEEDEKPGPQWGNRWYFFVPLVLVGLWLLQAVAWGVLYFVAPDAERHVRSLGAADSTGGIGLLLAVGDWVGIVGWVTLFLCYFVLLSRKRVSGWWALWGLCVGVNLPLYVVLLFRQPRWHARPPLAPLPSRPLGWDEPRRGGALLKNAFACESCDALLNHGVSECSECGERYRYEGGKPVPVEDTREP